jgi:mRNA interferase MazF
MSRYKKFDVVIVPFPYTDSQKTKKRPAVVLSDSSEYEKTGHSVCVMVTSAKNEPWPLDCPVTDLKSAGLPAPSVVRMKFFTIDNRLIQSKAGVLSKEDSRHVNEMVLEVLGKTK